MTTKNVIDEYFIKLTTDASDVEKKLKQALTKNTKLVEKFNQRLNKLEITQAKTNKKVSEQRQKGLKKESTLRNKQLDQMNRYYKQQEKLSSRAHNYIENMKARVTYGKLSISQQDKLNKKLSQASRILVQTGNADLFKEAQRDMTVMARQSGVIARNLKRAADQRMQARNDLKQGASNVAVGAGATAAGVIGLSTNKLLEVGKSQDRLINTFTQVFNGTSELKDLQAFIAKSGGSLEESANALTTSIPVLSQQFGKQTVPFFKDLTRIFAASNVEGTDQSEIIRQITQYSSGDGMVSKEDTDPILERLPLFANFLNDFVKDNYGKNLRTMTKESLLTSKIMNTAFKEFAKSKQVNELYSKAQNSMSKKQADLSNAIYKRWLETYDESGDELKDAMAELTKTINSKEGKAAFKSLARMLGGAYEAGSDLIRFGGSLATSSDNLLDSFGKLNSTTSKAVVALASLYGLKKAKGLASLLTSALKPLKSMNVAAAVVNVGGKGGGMMDKARKANSKIANAGKVAVGAASGASVPLAAMGGAVAYSAYKTDQNKDNILKGARAGDLGGRAQRALQRADEERAKFNNLRNNLTQPTSQSNLNDNIVRTATNNITNNNSSSPTINLTVNAPDGSSSSIVQAVRQELLQFASGSQGR